MATFAEIAADIIQKKLTGLLSIVAKNSNSHLKVFFSEGEIYYMGFGDVKGADCLGVCETLELTDCFFGAGAKVTVAEKVPLPNTSTIIERLKQYTLKTRVAEPMPRRSISERNVSEVQNQLKTALTRQVGPIGEMLFSNIRGQWNPASPPTKENYVQLIELFKAAIDDEKGRNEFLKEAGTIIS